jgi:hypothetical protein
MCPEVEKLIVPFALGDGAGVIGTLNAIDLLLRLVKQLLLGVRNAHVGDADRQTRGRRGLEAGALHVIEQVDRRRSAEDEVRVVDDTAASLLGQRAVIERHAVLQNVTEQHATDGGDDAPIPRQVFDRTFLAADDAIEPLQLDDDALLRPGQTCPAALVQLALPFAAEVELGSRLPRSGLRPSRGQVVAEPRTHLVAERRLRGAVTEVHTPRTIAAPRLKH